MTHYDLNDLRRKRRQTRFQSITKWLGSPGPCARLSLVLFQAAAHKGPGYGFVID